MQITKIMEQPCTTDLLVTMDSVDMVVPLDAGNRHYAAVEEAIAAGLAVEPLPPRDLAPDIRAEFARRIDAAFDGRRPSILSYAISLNGRVLIGLASGQTITQSLTAEEQADVALIWELDAWEGLMIERREALIAAAAGRSGASADAAYADDAHWPAAPAGLTPVWLKGF